MDDSRFDALTRAFTKSRSRRGLLQLLLSVALGGPLARFDLAEAKKKGSKGHRHRKRGGDRDRNRSKHRGADAQASKKKGDKPKSCPPCKTRKQGTCKGKKPDGTACPGGNCRGGSCIPASSTPICTPSCANKICGDNGCGGSCGGCAGDLNCQNGQCVLTCDSGLTPCAGSCVNLQTDTDHCGTCGTGCRFPHASASCARGMCVLETCDAGWDDCDGNPVTGCELDTRADPTNCGACGTECIAPPNATATCTNSTCSFTCDPGFHDCGGSCVSDSDPAHCGTACTPCPSSVCSPATCDGTTCGRAPIPGCCERDGDCGDSNACTTDTCEADHTCQHVNDHCPPDEVCIADGTQAHCCPQTRPLWDGSQCAECAPSDLTRCAPPPNATVTCDGQGTCSFACVAGWGDCGPGAGCETNLQTDNANCGTCGHVCTGDEKCRGGACTTCLPATEDLHAAIAAASPGETIRLCAGTWALTSTLQIGKNLTLIGAGDEQTILDGGNAVRVLSIATGTTVTLQDLQITRGYIGYATGTNFLDQSGGGIFNDGTLTLMGSHVTGNTANSGGGGICNDGTLTLRGSRVTGNTVLGYGGGIYNGGEIYKSSDAPMLTLEGSRVTGNAAGNEAGGIYNHLGTVTLQDSSVTDNSAVINCGGINSSGTLTLKGSTVSGNTADQIGGGICGGGMVTLEGSHVTANTTGTGAYRGYGGGIYFFGGTLTLKDGSSVTNNTADSGGGIMSDGATITLEGSSVTGNTATDRAGGIYVSAGGDSLRLRTGSSVEGNTAGEEGGGIYAQLGTVALEAGSHVTNNTAQDGGGIFNNPTYPAVVTLADTDIVTDNHLTDGTTVSNCAPVDTIPNCIG